MARYQQGIGVPDTLQDQMATLIGSLTGRQRGINVPNSLNAPLGTWKDPQGRVVQGDMPRFNAGVSRNYGSAGDYLDTMPSRWKAQSWENLNRLNKKVGKATGWGAQAQRNGRGSAGGDEDEGGGSDDPFIREVAGVSSEPFRSSRAPQWRDEPSDGGLPRGPLAGQVLNPNVSFSGATEEWDPFGDGNGLSAESGGADFFGNMNRFNARVDRFERGDITMKDATAGVGGFVSDIVKDVAEMGWNKAKGRMRESMPRLGRRQGSSRSSTESSGLGDYNPFGD